MKEQNLQPNNEQQQDRAIAFVSYAREDKDFALRLDESLRLKGMGVRGDWLLVRGMNYEDQLRDLLLGSDAFVFLISPDSVKSPACQAEINLATELKKRILPVVYRDSDESQLHPSLSQPQWTFLREKDDFVSGVQGLIEAINTDFDLMPEHRRLLAAAETWQRNDRNPSYLLRKEGLKRSEQWLSRTSEQPNKLPKPTSLQSEYILASQRNQSRGTRLAFGIVTGIAVALTILSIVALAQRRSAVRNAAEARDQKQLAESNAEDAGHQRDIAKGKAQEAEDRKREAETNAVEATRQKDLAQKNEQEAKKQQRIAEERRAEAERQRQLAVEANQIESGERATMLGQKPGREFEALEVALKATQPRLNHVGMPGAVVEGLSSAVGAAEYSLPLLGHTGDVASAAFSPDNRRLVTAGADGKARLWDTESGRLIATFALARSAYYLAHVSSASFSPDSSRLVTVRNYDSATDKYAAQIWDARTGAPLKTLKGHQGQVNSATFSPDGKWILTASSDHTAKIWNAETGDLVRDFKFFAEAKCTSPVSWGTLYVAAFSPDGLRVISAHQDGCARLWEANSGKILQTFPGGKQAHAAGFSPDGTSVLLNHHRFKLNVGNASPVNAIPYWARAAEFSPDGALMVSAGGHVPSIINLRTATTTELHFGNECDALAGDITEAAFSADGKRILSAHNDGSARLWNASTGELIDVLQGHVESILSLAFSTDGSHVVTGSADRTARLWNTRVDRSVVTLGEPKDDVKVWEVNPNQVNAAVFSPVDNALVLTAHNDGTARLWNANTGAALKKFETGKPVQRVAFAPDGSRIFTSDEVNTILWDAVSGVRIVELEGRLTPSEFYLHRSTRAGQRDSFLANSFSADSQSVLTCSKEDWFMWDVHTGKLIRRKSSHDIASATFSPDGKLIAIVDSSSNESLADAKTGEFVRLLVHNDRVGDNFVSFSSDSSIVVTPYSADIETDKEDNIVNPDRTAQLRDAHSGKLLATLLGHTKKATAASLSPDGRQVVTASEDETARVWNAENGQPLFTLRGHTAGVWLAVFSPDGGEILTVAGDRKPRLWNAHTGKLIAVLPGHGGQINSAAFSADGTRIVTASRDGTAKIYSAVIHDILDGYLREAHTYLHPQ